ncbi:DUF397 domain-containing protein [Saccharopolyspora sp. NPDC047091]
MGGAPGIAGVRDTKDRDGGTLRITSARWTAFLAAIASGRYDR